MAVAAIGAHDKHHPDFKPEEKRVIFASSLQPSFRSSFSPGLIPLQLSSLHCWPLRPVSRFAHLAR
jgi:hypothetical protein